MNANQQQSIISTLDQIESINFEENFELAFGNEANPNETSLGEFSYAEFVSLTKRMTKQLRVKLEDPFGWMMLPANHNFQNDFGSCVVDSNLTNLNAYISNRDYSSAIVMLKSLIYYQIANNFWDNVEFLSSRSRVRNIEIVEEKLNFVTQNSEARIKAIDLIIQEVRTLQSDLFALYSSKTTEFEEITANLAASNTYVKDIATKLSTSNTNSTQIEQYNVKCKALLDKLIVMQTEIAEQQNASKEALETLQADTETELTRITTENTTKLSKITEDHQYVEGKKEEVVNMMALIADGALGHSFHHRGEAINKSVKLWLWISVVAAILMGGWIFTVFTWLNINTGNAVADMFINVAKTSPLVVLLWFSLRQYQKERNLLEEYAFRKAMAVTLNAYLDRLNGEEDEHKRKLLLETVEKLYTMPKITNEGIGLLSFRSKDLVNLMKELNATLKEVKK